MKRRISKAVKINPRKSINRSCAKVERSAATIHVHADQGKNINNATGSSASVVRE